jgi:diguanylate cyclase (GGDEF)-like protein
MNERRFNPPLIHVHELEHPEHKDCAYPEHTPYFFEPLDNLNLRILSGESVPRDEIMDIIREIGNRVERNTGPHAKTLTPEQQHNIDRLYHSVLNGLISTLAETNELLSQDELTGASVRRVLLGRVQSVLKRMENIKESEKLNSKIQSYLAIAVIDLDCMKYLNDTHGYEFGDKALNAACESVTSSLQGSLRKEDVIARIGGDEFIVVISGELDRGNTELTVDQIIESFKNRIGTALSEITIDLDDNTSFPVNASVGFSHMTSDDEILSFSKVKSDAESEMKKVKRERKEGLR